MRRFAICLLALPLCLAEVRIGRFQNRDSWVVETPTLRVSIMQSGGHVAEIVLKGGTEVNPLWVQNRPTLDADQYDPAKHEKLYGGGPGARLMAGLVGHNLCFPFWGNPSEAEYKEGMTFHGETGIVRWKRMAGSADTILVSADLPESSTRFTRSPHVAGQIVYLRGVWGESEPLGPPRGMDRARHLKVRLSSKKGVTVTDASLTRGRVNGDTSGREFAWPAGVAEEPIDLRTVRNIPRSGFVNNFLVDPAGEYGFFAAHHPGLKLLFGYVFPRKNSSWLSIWEANNPDMLTRGMEFSNTPTHGTMKELIKAPEVFGIPAYEWLDGKGKITKTFAAFSARVPEGYKGVADVRRAGQKLEIVERETGQMIKLDFDNRKLALGINQ
jgi:hypothetical protein